jgi:hypothetical protein
MVVDIETRDAVLDAFRKAKRPTRRLASAIGRLSMHGANCILIIIIRRPPRRP